MRAATMTTLFYLLASSAGNFAVNACSGPACSAGSSLMQKKVNVDRMQTTVTTTMCASFEDKYRDMVKVDFALGEIIRNNLGGNGPDVDVAEELYYKGVAGANSKGDTYDLRVTTMGRYATNRPQMNGANGYYGVVNVLTGNTVDLKFEFIDPKTGAATTLKKVFFSWFDIDQGPNSKSQESITLWPGYTDTFLAEGSEVEKTMVDCPAAIPGSCAAFKSTTAGTGRGNPKDPMSLTKQQGSRTFAVLYEDVSNFSVTLSAGDGFGSRNFLFTGMSQVVFASVKECCPDHICKELGDLAATTTGEPPTRSEVCENAALLEFTSANLLENTLGDGAASARMFFKNVTTHDGRAVDLSITDASRDLEYVGDESQHDTFLSDAREYTGEYKGAARIGIDRPGSYAFKFKLTSEGDSVKLPLFPLVFYDIDGEGESITACNVASVIVPPGSRLQENEFEGCYTHNARGREVNLPDDFEVLSRNQKQMSVSYVYANTAEWFIEVTVNATDRNRYVVFKGSNILACDSEAGLAPAWGKGRGKKKGDE